MHTPPPFLHRWSWSPASSGSSPTPVPLHQFEVPEGLQPPPVGHILIAHGLGEHQGRYARLSAALMRAGWWVWSYDHWGHGDRAGPRGDVPHADALVNDLRWALQWLREQAPAGVSQATGLSLALTVRMPLILLGHSMGGALAARAALAGSPSGRSRPALDGLILSSPAVGLPMTAAQHALAWVARHLAPHRGFPNGLNPQWLSRDPKEVLAYRQDRKVHRLISPMLLQTLRECGDAVRRDATNWSVPTWILVGMDDRCVDPMATVHWARQLPPERVQLDLLHDAKHEIFNEIDRDALIVQVTKRLHHFTIHHTFTPNRSAET